MKITVSIIGNFYFDNLNLDSYLIFVLGGALSLSLAQATISHLKFPREKATKIDATQSSNSNCVMLI